MFEEYDIIVVGAGHAGSEAAAAAAISWRRIIQLICNLILFTIQLEG
jgi:tRNA uridine 5-carboxymethylaminomethyl modification enzyme